MLVEKREPKAESAFFPSRTPSMSFRSGYRKKSSSASFLSKKETEIERPVEAATDLRPGDMVEHTQFGSGLVIALDGKLVSVAFKRAGVKKMMLGIAPLKKL